MKAFFKLTILLLGPLIWLSASAEPDPLHSLSPEEKSLLKPQIERWIHGQMKHDWSDLWEIQDQTPQLKNELLLGHKDAPDMDRRQYAEAMRNTIGTGYPEIKAFMPTEVDKESDGYQMVGCAKLRREGWKATTIQYVPVKIVNGKVRFGWPDGSAERCKLR